MNHLKMHSLNKIDENVSKIAALFPNCVTEAKADDGSITKKIDFDMLKQELSSTIVEGREERYQFTWPDKKKSVLLANAPISKTLRPCREESVDFDTTENIYIEGDNLEALKLLQENYLGKIKMIYIDPPYNTGNDFVYNDEFSVSSSEFSEKSGNFDEEGNQLVDNYTRNTESNGRFHTDWLNMMYPRLKLARDLLTDDGVIFISIDDNEIDNLKKICNEIFGEINLVAEIPWQSRASIQNDTDFSVNHEYICVYAKKRRLENRRLKESNYTEWHSNDTFVCKPLPLDKSKFDNPDNDPRGLWKADPFDAPNVRPNLTYPVTNPNTGEEHLPPRGRCWRFLPAKFSSALADNRIVWTNNGLGRPQLKVFYEEKKEFGSVDNSWFSADRIGTSTNGTKELMKLFDGQVFFDTPKPTSLLLKLIDLANTKDNDIILDFFSGSATTAHAVMQLNAEDSGHRKFIMVQLPEATDEKSEAYKAGYKNICEIGKERIRRAGQQILKQVQNDKEKISRGLDFANAKSENDLFSNTETSLDVSNSCDNKKLDVGFRVLKCDTSNMEDVYYTPEHIDKSTLFKDNIKSDRTGEDLLFQTMLDLGIMLSSKIETRKINGKDVFCVEGNYLMACFDKDVTEDVITEIAKMKPYYFVMRDPADAQDGDSLITNFEQIFTTYSPETVRKVL